jgi:AraC-like DNA-binding protein
MMRIDSDAPFGGGNGRERAGVALSVSPFFGLLHSDMHAALAREARYVVHDMGGVTAVRMTMPAARVTRLPWDSGEAGADDIQLAVLIDGAAAVTMGEEAARLGAGDWIVLDQRRASTWAVNSNSTFFGLQIPRRRFGRIRLPSMLASRGTQSAEAETGEMSGIHGVMSNFLRTVEAQLAHIAGEAVALLADAAVGLLAAVLEEERSRSRVPPDSLAMLRLRASQFVSAHAADAELGVEGVARALNCSTRYLYKAFAGESISPEKLIWNARLERSCQALLDPKNLHRPVGTIAFENGFNSDAHFARTFKASYGMPPGRFRLMAAALARPSDTAAD